ncbi:hypothetical protein [Roseateles asaccharophilus]|uniref:Uncharacterized protein n=1 Tax=Roseateles asaccharophilus TaxID=582607 RepID=A0ABU2A6F6_9BURK|nr:hypothetical protein [Roseateles asaccharophilus]MDR7332067.1 hypothetical protein [Roseateles asaccharophilus]
MHPADAALLALVESRGHALGDLFLAEGRVYASDDAGDFQSTSTYEALHGLCPEDEAKLIAFLRRLAVPEYVSIVHLDDEIVQVREWESLHGDLERLLQQHGRLGTFGEGDFILVDDYYSSLQHKIECISPDAFTSSLVDATQAVLKRYPRRWEVIFVAPAAGGGDHAYSVYADQCIKRSE